MAAGSQDLLDLACRIAGQAGPGEQIEAYAARSISTSIKVHEGDIDSLTRAQDEGIGIRVVKDGRQGLASCTVLTDDALAETLADARDNASFGSVDEWAGLAEPDGVDHVDLDLWRDGVASTSIDDKIAIAVELERLVRKGDPRIRAIRTSSYGDSASMAAIATSTGIAQTWGRTGASCGIMAIGGQGDDTSTGTGSWSGYQPSDLDIEAAAAEAVERCVRKLGATKPTSSTVTMVLDPAATPALLSLLAALANGESVEKKRSILAGRLGEQVASPLVTLVSDPTDPASLGARTHDAEGLAARRNVILEDGVLRTFLYNCQVARRAGLASTGSAARGALGASPGIGASAVSLRPGASTPASIIEGVQHGILVESFIGLNSGVSLVSGDLSVGVSGVMIRDGEVAEPVKECTVASTLQRMLADVVAVGDDLRWRGSVAGLTLAIADLRLAGT